MTRRSIILYFLCLNVSVLSLLLGPQLRPEVRVHLLVVHMEPGGHSCAQTFPEGSAQRLRAGSPTPALCQEGPGQEKAGGRARERALLAGKRAYNPARRNGAPAAAPTARAVCALRILCLPGRAPGFVNCQFLADKKRCQESCKHVVIS